MTAAWAAGGVRARALSSRRLGAQGARAVVASGDLGAAVAQLAQGPYGHDVRPGQGLAAAQRAVAATYLWHLRVLAGWLPRPGVEVVRLLAGWAELANIESLLRSLGPAPPSGASAAPPYELGSLATVWPRLQHEREQAAVRRVLGA